MLRVLIWLISQQAEGFEEQFDSTQRLLHSLVDDICTSVPFHLGNRDAHRELEAVKWPHYPEASADDAVCREVFFKGVGAVLIPLCTCLRVPGLADAQKEWLGKQIERVSQIETGQTTKADSIRLDDLPYVYFHKAINVR